MAIVSSNVVRLPKPTNRTSIVGSTGSGKTCFAVWLLSSRDYHNRPCFIFDFKGDELLARIPAQEISIAKKPPKEPGLYIVRPLPGDEELVSEFLMRIWAMENSIIYIDEGYMLPKAGKWFRACLTQGRSKKIEMIVLSQRPVWMDKYVFTEADFFAVFRLNSIDDRKHLRNFLDGSEVKPLAEYHCHWYDVGENRLSVFAPCPTGDEIIARFERRVSDQRLRAI